MDKPSGPTSHDVVDRVRKALRQRRVGHTGTLDPFATGVLPVCVGKATRLARFLSGGEKTYRATVRLGLATTTDDLHGEPLGEPRPVRLARSELEAACRTLTGSLMQVPPAYSAKHVEGRRAYALAREGRSVRPLASPVAVHAFDVLGFEGDTAEVEVRCSAGTYVRALARDLGEALGVGGHLTALRRTRSGAFGLEEAVGWEALDTGAADRVVPLSRLLPELPAVVVGDEGLAALRHGRDLAPALIVSGLLATLESPPPPRWRVLGPQGDLLALAVPRAFGAPPPGTRLEPTLHPDVVLLPSHLKG